MNSPDHPPSADILVVDDTPANLDLLIDILSAKGYRVRPVTDGATALKVVKAKRPDLVLLDVTMPGLSGYELCRKLKADAALRDIPVLFVSALSASDEKVEAFAAGGVDYVTKPFHAEEVVARVSAHLELSRNRQALARSLEELRQLEAHRDSLTHMIAHDMRSPLLALSLSLEMLDHPPGHPDPELRQLVKDGRQAVTTLVEMIAQMLDVSRMESTQLPLEIEEIDLTAIAGQVLGDVRLSAGNRRFQLDHRGEVRVRADATLLRRVLGNLVGNAIKYSPAGSLVTVRVGIEGGNARVEVCDEGPGIRPELQARIFEKFGQAEAADAKRGFGIGLAFVRLAIAAHHGTVGVMSPSGKGAMFWFTVPVSGPVDAQPAP